MYTIFRKINGEWVDLNKTLPLFQAVGLSEVFRLAGATTYIKKIEALHE